jgi:hypothetical protein
MRRHDNASKRGRPKPKKQRGIRTAVWLIGATVALGLLVLVGTGALIWVLTSSARTRSTGHDDKTYGAGPDDSEPALDISRDPVALRQRKAAIGLDISAPAEPSPDKWTVTPDKIKPVEGIRSVFAWPEADPLVRPHALLLTPVDVARAAVTFPQKPRPTTWLRYDLKAVDPIGRVDLGDYRPTPDDPPESLEKNPENLIDLSPTGDRLAIQTTDNPPRVHVWDAEGKRVAKLKPTDAKAPITWIGFIDDSRMLTLEGERLRLRDLGTGQVTYIVKGTFRAPVVLSPRRTWAAAFDGTAFVWLRTADGVIGGRTPLPALKPQAGEFVGTVHGAFSPDGTRFVASRSAHGPMGFFRCLSVWDVATGKPTDAGDYQVPSGLPEPVQWCGPRQILLGGWRMADLDLAQTVWEYTPRDLNGCAALSTPDARFWYLPNLRRPHEVEGVLELLKESKFHEQVEKSGYVLAAWTLPHAEAKARIEAHRNARLLGHMELRIVVQHDDAAFSRKAGDAVADSLSALGSRISPTAAGVARLTIRPVKNGKVEKSVGLPGRVVTLVPGKIIETKLEILDQQKTQRWAVTLNGEAPDSAANPEAAARTNLLANLRLVIAGNKSTVTGTTGLPSLDTGSELGIDGLPDPPPRDQPKK